MKFYIYKKDQVIEVKPAKYKRWLKRKAKNFLLSPLSLHVGKRNYRIETHYYGVGNNKERVQPFVLYFWDQESEEHKPKLYAERLSSFDALKRKYVEYVQLIATKIEEFVKN